MIYLSWAAMYEGPTEQSYLGQLIPNLMEDLVRQHGISKVSVPQTPAVILSKLGRDIKNVAQVICREREAFFLAFIHADTGGRALEAGIATRSEAYKQAAFDLCKFRLDRCIIVAPRHETEAWILADRDAIGDALGYNGDLAALGLPDSAKAAEKVTDPKSILKYAIDQVRGKRSRSHVGQVIPAIAARQNLTKLRGAESFISFESELLIAMRSLGCVK